VLGVTFALAGIWFGPEASAGQHSPCQPLHGAAWCAVVTPHSGPIGTRVTITGRIDPGVGQRDLGIYVHNFRVDPGDVFLGRDVPGPPFCEVIGGVHAAHVSVTDSGRIHGSFIVGGSTVCNHSTTPAPPIMPGTYNVTLQCMACQVDTFTVTPTPGTLAFSGSGRLVSVGMVGLMSAVAGVALCRVGRRRIN
jgi:hypothetical protein